MDRKIQASAKKLIDLDDWLTVYRSITLVKFQLDVQNCLFIYV